MSSEVFVIDYTEKSIAVFGNTKPYIEELKNIGGKYNHNLKYKDGTSPGWIFPKTKHLSVKQLITKINEGKITPSEPNEQKTYERKEQKKEEKLVKNDNIVMSKEEFAYIMKTLTRLEQDVAELKRGRTNSKIEDYIKKKECKQEKIIETPNDEDDDNDDNDEDDDDNDDEDEEEIEEKVIKKTISKGPSLLRKK